ncbi:MAG: hypothetical protein E7464_01050 [Ruminococcaceae bacterium]|nr:hypothetical protein [Oscillospiraceae bacterium]
MSSYYYINALQKHHFIITPEELRLVLQSCHHVSSNGVARTYTESDPDEFFRTYEKLYEKMRNGDRLIWQQDHQIAAFSTGITKHPENCRYEAAQRRSLPNFLEPCVMIDTFCFFLYRDSLSVSFSPTQFPENVMGLCLFFPKTVEYTQENEKHGLGIVSCEALDDYDTYQHILSEIKSITKPLKLQIGEKTHRSKVRISRQAKAELANAYFITSHKAQLL